MECIITQSPHCKKPSHAHTKKVQTETDQSIDLHTNISTLFMFSCGLLYSIQIQDYYLIIDIKMCQNINHITVHSKTYILKLEEQLLKIQKIHNKQTSNLHTHMHTDV